jgi:hypothetical protein
MRRSPSSLPCPAPRRELLEPCVVDGETVAVDAQLLASNSAWRQPGLDSGAFARAGDRYARAVPAYTDARRRTWLLLMLKFPDVVAVEAPARFRPAMRYRCLTHDNRRYVKSATGSACAARRLALPTVARRMPARTTATPAICTEEGASSSSTIASATDITG